MKLLTILGRSSFRVVYSKNSASIYSNIKCRLRRPISPASLLLKLPFIPLSFPLVQAKALEHEKRINIFQEARMIEANKKGFGNKVRFFFWNIWDVSQTVFRSVLLAFYFTPLVILWPISLLHENLKRTWYNLLVTVLEFSGPIFIKLGQWASMRRDLFNEDLCEALSSLQRHTKPHSWFYTKHALDIAYGPNWPKLFTSFDSTPIGSGCCAQVYQAKLRPEFASLVQKDLHRTHSIDSWWLDFVEVTGIASLIDYFNPSTPIPDSKKCNSIPVAVKVRHPRVDTLLRRDLTILHAAAVSISFVAPAIRWLSLTECVDEFAYTMSSQINLAIESNNLERFAINFKQSNHVVFPKPFKHLVRPFILVETFEEGQCVDEFIKKGRISTELADLGISTILKMVFIDSFAHGDLHPGNILVQENGFENLKIVFLDCGIVAPLDLQSAKAIRGVFRAIALGDGEQVAQLFLDHSENNCTNEELFKAQMSGLVQRAIHHTYKQHKDISGLMRSLFSTLIEHEVRLDAAFSSVILAIMVLEGLGRSLDPNIDLVDRARPFLIGLK